MRVYACELSHDVRHGARPASEMDIAPCTLCLGDVIVTQHRRGDVQPGMCAATLFPCALLPCVLCWRTDSAASRRRRAAFLSPPSWIGLQASAQAVQRAHGRPTAQPDGSRHNNSAHAGVRRTLVCVCVTHCAAVRAHMPPTALASPSHGTAVARLCDTALHTRPGASARARPCPPARAAATTTRRIHTYARVWACMWGEIGDGNECTLPRVCDPQSHVCVCDEVGTCWCATAALARAGGGSSGVPRWSRPRQRRAHRPRHMRTYVCTCVWVCVGGRPRMCACACACAWADPLLKCPGSHVARYLAHLPTVAHACVRARTTDKRKEYACP